MPAAPLSVLHTPCPKTCVFSSAWHRLGPSHAQFTLTCMGNGHCLSERMLHLPGQPRITDSDRGRQVAVKVLKGKQDERTTAAFAREVAILSAGVARLCEVAAAVAGHAQTLVILNHAHPVHASSAGMPLMVRSWSIRGFPGVQPAHSCCKAAAAQNSGPGCQSSPICSAAPGGRSQEARCSEAPFHTAVPRRLCRRRPHTARASGFSFAWTEGTGCGAACTSLIISRICHSSGARQLAAERIMSHHSICPWPAHARGLLQTTGPPEALTPSWLPCR